MHSSAETNSIDWFTSCWSPSSRDILKHLCAFNILARKLRIIIIITFWFWSLSWCFLWEKDRMREVCIKKETLVLLIRLINTEYQLLRCHCFIYGSMVGSMSSFFCVPFENYWCSYCFDRSQRIKKHLTHTVDENS